MDSVQAGIRVLEGAAICFTGSVSRPEG